MRGYTPNLPSNGGCPLIEPPIYGSGVYIFSESFKKVSIMGKYKNVAPSVVVVKTGSFANWITAASAVATLAVVAVTANALLEEVDKVSSVVRKPAEMKEKVVKKFRKSKIRKWWK